MKTKKYILSSLLSLTLLIGCAYSKSFSFTPSEHQWSFYGEGLGSYVTNVGRGKDQSSLWLSTDFGETETAFYTWKDLAPGIYKVITYVKAQDVQKNKDGVSFWHFYDGGFGTLSPFMDLSGSYDWRKIEYTINVKSSDLTVWFRLKSPGQVWVDDFYIEKVETGQDKVLIETEKTLSEISYNNNLTKLKGNSRKKLYSFDGAEVGHPFSVKNKIGQFTPQKFFNFNLANMPIKDWSAFDRIEMEVFNPNENYTDFFVTLQDDKTTDYWSQLNHKQTLAPGWNKLSFSLSQYLGERGSHRFQRPINLAKLKKFFVVIDPDSKSNYVNKSFLIDNISLSSNPMPEIPKNVWAFDFTSHKAQLGSNLKRVTTQTGYNDQRGYGFIEPAFWRVEDSQHTSEALRYSIGILKGHFRLKLPNGKYQINLVVDKLGYWDVPFWSDRMVSVNGSPVFKETRSSGEDFLTDLLKFESIIPELKDHPYDLYLKKSFHIVDKTVEVKNGYLDIELEGDETGISLNTLIVWDKNNESEGVKYKNSFEKRNKEEFDWMSRSIQQSDNKSGIDKLSISIVEPDLYLKPNAVKQSIGTQLNFQGGCGERPYQVLQFNSGAIDQKVSWSMSDFINDKGEKILKSQIALSDLIYQFTSPDINHETYLLAGKYLNPMQDVSYALKKNHTKYLVMQLDINDKLPIGKFIGEVIFHHGSQTTTIPVEINILNYTLPKIEFPVGFFGIDPLPFSYFKGSSYKGLRKKYRHLALRSLGEAGFTTFTGLPSDVSDLNDLFKESAKYGVTTVYSYGGQFPQNLIGNDEASFIKASAELKSLLSNKNWPKIIHTFSDEAGGYSDKTTADIELAKKLKKHFPFMSLGGFGSFHGGDSKKLNSYFDYGFFSSLSKGDIVRLKDNNQRWGYYNASAGNLDDPRFSFGLGLFIARQNGLSQYLEWHATAFNNYPYYDFDGRESDSVMFYPTTNGKLLHSLRFVLATEGLHAYKKLKLLESVVLSGSANPQAIKEAKSFLDGLRREHYFYSSTTFLSNKKVNFRDFETKLNNHLKILFAKK